MQVCDACRQPNSSDARFCSRCGARLSAASTVRELRKTVTVVFCDLVESTRLGERLDSEALRRVMGEFYERLGTVLKRHGDPAQHLAGDAVIAFFGIPTVGEDDALRAVRAAVGMRTAVADLTRELGPRLGIELRVRIGVNTGVVVADEGARGFVVGDAVNVAARLQGAASAGEILIGQSTHSLVHEVVKAEGVDPLELKGKIDLVTAFRVLEVAQPGAEPGDAFDTPFVGRPSELAGLRDAYERAVRESSCVLTVVSGDAGVGKSRLVAEFLRTIEPDARVLSGRCLAYGEGITFWPLAQVVRQSAAIHDDDLSEAALAKLRSLLAAAEDTDAVVDRLAGAIGLSSFAASPQDIAWALGCLLELLATERPVILVLEDIHWAEPTFLEVVESVAEPGRGAPILMVCLARTELRADDRLDEQLSTTEIRLDPMSEATSRELVEGLLDSEKLADDMWEPIKLAAAGNPLFLGELVRVLLDDGVLRREEDGCWRATGDFSDFTMPSSVQALLTSRLERLSTGQRRLLERASIVGQEFWPAAIYELSPDLARADVDDHLAALSSLRLIRPAGTRVAGEPTLGFSHGLAREVAYQTLLKETRAELHQRFADWLAEIAGERIAEYEEIVGYHLEQAYRSRRALAASEESTVPLGREAAQRIGSAGRRALARGDMPAAVNLLERAIALLPEDEPERSDLSLKLSLAFAETGEATKAEAILSERLGSERLGRHFLAYVDGSGRQRAFTLSAERSPVSIGREPGNDLRLEWDGEVSRRHAAIHWVQPHWVVVDDARSRNGSFVNGKRVTGKHPLADGEVLRLGNTSILYRAPITPKRPRSSDLSQSTVTRAQL